MTTPRFASLLVPSALSFILASAGPALAAGGIAGAVHLEGKAPERKDVVMQSDAFCAGRPVVKDEEVVVGKAGELKNVVVRIAKGVANPPPPPRTNVVLDQQGCMYRPRVAV